MRLEYFQMIDEVVAVNTAEASIVARSVVPRESPVFEGHFPGYPLTPGVLLIETMAQASGFLMLALNQFSQMPLLACVKRAKLRAPVTPLAEITIRSTVEHDGSGFAVMNADIHEGGALACDAELTLKMIPFPAPEMREHLLATVERAGLMATEN